MPVGQPAELVGNWGFEAGSLPQGAPVSLVEMVDGSILITEDRMKMQAQGLRSQLSYRFPEKHWSGTNYKPEKRRL